MLLPLCGLFTVTPRFGGTEAGSEISVCRWCRALKGIAQKGNARAKSGNLGMNEEKRKHVQRHAEVIIKEWLIEPLSSLIVQLTGIWSAKNRLVCHNRWPVTKVPEKVKL
jgi:hypothetical protein